MGTCAFDHPRGDRPPGSKGLRVVEVGLLVLQVAGALVGPLACLGLEVTHGGLAPDGSSDDAGLALEDCQRLLGNKGLARRIGLAEKQRAAAQMYSTTWIQSTTIVTAMLRRRASALITSIWCLAPSTRATQGRR